jgi:hypothetical protein
LSLALEVSQVRGEGVWFYSLGERVHTVGAAQALAFMPPHWTS